MPLYSISTKQALSFPMREALANVILRSHCTITNAPEAFVNVIFHQNVPLRPKVNINVMANVRRGRTHEMNNDLCNELKRRIAELMAIQEQCIELSLFEVSASKVMEGGEILPEPGEESLCEWLKEEV